MFNLLRKTVFNYLIEYLQFGSSNNLTNGEESVMPIGFVEYNSKSIGSF